MHNRPFKMGVGQLDVDNIKEQNQHRGAEISSQAKELLTVASSWEKETVFLKDVARVGGPSYSGRPRIAEREGSRNYT